MSDHAGEKTEQPTPRRLEDALKKGMIPRSAELQTLFVLLGGILAFVFAGREIWSGMIHSMTSILGHLHEISLTPSSLTKEALSGAFAFSRCIWPVGLACLGAALLGGGLQTQFHTAPDALAADWTRLNPVSGFRRIFSIRSLVPTFVGTLKLSLIIGLAFDLVQGILADPIFYASVDVARIADFLAKCSFRIVVRVTVALAAIAALDYAYQFWRTHRDLMMTREELKDEMKNSEGNPLVKSQQRRKRQAVTHRKMLADVPTADVVVTNPTHFAVALRYRRGAMKAPRVIAKGSRLHALRIREIAAQHQVPVLENKPLARLLFKYGRVGGEIPAQLYAAVAEILAWVYRTNAYRYYRELNSAR